MDAIYSSPQGQAASAQQESEQETGRPFSASSATKGGNGRIGYGPGWGEGVLSAPATLLSDLVKGRAWGVL